MALEKSLLILLSMLKLWSTSSSRKKEEIKNFGTTKNGTTKNSYIILVLPRKGKTIFNNYKGMVLPSRYYKTVVKLIEQEKGGNKEFWYHQKW